ncbi:MAG: hypothetical protein DRG82_06730 [Deltaproteobacteria bacterium]|nr:MAG: hypothetical protein DRG82_06730 [Deltaproteobacteria bacterium]
MGKKLSGEISMVSTHPAPSRHERRGSRKPIEEIKLQDRLSLISLIDEGMRTGAAQFPMVADLFNNLWDLVTKTARGSRIDPLKPEDTRNGFRVFEINAETGENLGRLNMLYLKKSIPCYYLVYVEVASPFRRKGLGHRILDYFRDFLIRKSAVGILDNIIPEEDPTYTIYFKHAWEPVDAIIGERPSNGETNYMVYIPPKFQGRDLREPFLKILYHLDRKRASIDMRDNEMMVQSTITEFKDIYSALLTYFDRDLSAGKRTPFMRFMFTRLVTKFIAFRRRIADLVGYTGGDSLEQMVLDPQISILPAQSYSPSTLQGTASFVAGDTRLWEATPLELKKNPAQFIQGLPNYRRPSLLTWLKEKGKPYDEPLTIGELLDIGFDPTRLKEITMAGEEYIFERVQARQLTEILMKKELLERLGKELSGTKVRNARLRVNPPILIVRDRGNGYVFREKIPAIHWEEAMEQIQAMDSLRQMNNSMNIKSLLLSTVRETGRILETLLDGDERTLLDRMAYFVSWDIPSNRPGLVIDFTSLYVESVWLA